MTDHHYDFFVIGAGSGGVRAARIAAQHGAKVGIAEVGDLGGTCVNLGCVPKKLFSHAGEYGEWAEQAHSYGWDIQVNGFDWPTLRDNKNNEIKRLNGIYHNLLDGAGVDVWRDHAAFIDANRLQVGEAKITADKILIATGSHPRMPDFEGSEYTVSSDRMFHLDALPNKLVIIGGGYIAVEFAFIMHALGVSTTLAYRGTCWLRGFDDDIRTHLAEEAEQAGMDIRFNTDPAKIEAGSNAYTLHTKDGQQIDADLVMAAIGRTPNIQKLGIENAGIQLNEAGRIAIDENSLVTTHPSVYALGDVANEAQLTPLAIEQGHTLADRLFGGQPDKKLDTSILPSAIFSHPPGGTVGLTQAQARNAGYALKIYRATFRPLRHTLTGLSTKAMLKLVVDKDDDKVLGCHMVGADAPEIMQGFAAALSAGATKADIDRTIAIHPTTAEEFVTMRAPVEEDD